MAASLSARLTQMNMLVSGTALLLAGAAFAAHDLLTFRDAAVRNLLSRAQIAESTSVSALLFGDAQMAERTLAALGAAPEIVSALIYEADGRLFASYRRDAETGPPVLEMPAGEEAWRVSSGAVAVVRRIAVDGEPIGFVYIERDLEAMYARLGSYGLIVAGVLLFAGVAALIVSRVAQRVVAEPIGEVAAVAHRVSQEKDYSVRVHTKPTTAEVAVLAASFNDMLAQIQQQEHSLRVAHEELEERVRQRTAELHALNQELEAFSYSVSHDLRAPLRHVTGFANLLAKHAGPALDRQGHRYLRTITEAAARMGTLIDDLLTFSRMGRAALSKRRVELSSLVREARDDVSTEVNGRRVVWHVGPLPAVEADPALLKPALVNLFSNAVKYTSTREEAHIEVGTAGAGRDEVVLYVRDNGVGFDMTYAEKLFGVFQRLHRSDEFPGTGIGLANVRRIVQRHGGRTWAEAAVDQGATFYISLPAARSGHTGAGT